MDDLDLLKPRNPLTTLRHRREVLWQITLPVAGFTLVLLVLAVLAATTSAQKASLWADISVIFLVIPAMFFALITMIIFAAGVYLITRLLQVLPFQFFRAQNGLFRISLQVARLTNRMVEPVLKVHSFNAAARTFTHQVWRRPAQPEQENKR